MRITVAGAEITDAVAEVLDTLQNNTELSTTYLQELDRLTRDVILDISGVDEENDSEILHRLRTLQMIRRDIATLSMPPDADLPENDTPAFEA